MTKELIVTIIPATICNVLLFFTFNAINEVPVWAKFIIPVLFNICIGMVLMAYLVNEGGRTPV